MVGSRRFRDRNIARILVPVGIFVRQRLRFQGFGQGERSVACPAQVEARMQIHDVASHDLFRGVRVAVRKGPHQGMMRMAFAGRVGAAPIQCDDQ